MKLFKVHDGYEHCYVVAVSAESALELQEVQDYFECAEDPLQAIEIPPDEPLTIQMDDYQLSITHTAREWCAIYDKTMQIACSQW